MRNKSIKRKQDDRFKRCEGDEEVGKGVQKAGGEKERGTSRMISIDERKQKIGI
jgi:hypothetical protein